jgi:DNA invertase Pin-like site-specific DNA recombinase
MIVGYSRTSTSDQHAGLEAQERDLKAAGAERIFSEQVSSVAQRDRLQEARLARSTAELLTIEKDLTERKVDLVVLSMGGERFDTRNPTAKLMLTILAGAWLPGNRKSCWSVNARASPRRRARASIRAGSLRWPCSPT